MPLQGNKIGLYGLNRSAWRGIPRMQLSHAFPVRSMVFDDPNLVSHAGLVPAIAIAERAGLIELADRHLTVAGGPPGHAAGLKVSARVAARPGWVRRKP